MKIIFQIKELNLEEVLESFASKNNNYFLEKFHTSGSGIISSNSNTDGIIEINEDIKYIKKGTLLKFYRYEDILN